MTPAFFKKTVQRYCIFFAVIFFLVACSPKLDWRVVQSPQERYTALFPGKPEKIQRRIAYQDQELLQTLEALKIEDDIYSISATQLPITQSALLAKLLSQLQDNLLARAKDNGGQVMIEDILYHIKSKPFEF
jgi:hypothetical protein